jgi:phosphohistidine phosphatase
MAQWLAEVDAVPDMILSSTSVRTRETTALMLHEWSAEPAVSFSESLYLATPETILKTIRSDGCDARRLMVIAHNPGITQLVSSLAKQEVEMPTAAIAVFQLGPIDWSTLKAGTPMSLIHHMRPKAL